MPLSRALLNVLLTYPCPRCGHELEMKGSWFRTIRNYRCGSCKQEIRMTYGAKIALFNAHNVRMTRQPG